MVTSNRLITGLFLAAMLANPLNSKAQLVFRNSGPDTLRIAVATYYDTSKKAIMAKGWYTKPVIVRGWYRLYPGDSVVIGKFMGPAVYYSREKIRDNRYTVGDTAGSKDSYREEFYTARRTICDTNKFAVVHPVKSTTAAQQYMVGFFRVYLLSEEVRKSGRLLIELGQKPKG